MTEICPECKGLGMNSIQDCSTNTDDGAIIIENCSLGLNAARLYSIEGDSAV